MNIEQIKEEQQLIVHKMYSDLQNTEESARYFTSQNIEECALVLDKYIDMLDKSNQQPDEIAKSIQQVCSSLSTFNQEDEELGYLWGFLYNGYTDLLTNFILNTAYAFGLQNTDCEFIEINNIQIKHNPHYLDLFTVYFGSDANNGVLLLYNKQKECFEFEENPYGESYTIPIFNLQICENETTLSFEVLTEGIFTKFLLKSQRKIDQFIIKAVSDLSNENRFTDALKPDFCSISITLEKGVLVKLQTTNYDKQNRIINMFTEGSGITILQQELDDNRKFQNSSNLIPHPEIVNKEFILIDAIPYWKYYEVARLTVSNNNISVTTKNLQFEYKDENRDQVISLPIEPKTFNYEIKTFLFMQQLLNGSIALLNI